jgi:hypothetical protein
VARSVSWKRTELEIARRLGGERVPVSGRTRGWAPDVSHPWLAIECKERKNMPVLLATAMDQAEKSAAWSKKRGEGDKLPIAIVHQKGQHMANALVCMRLSDFEEWFVNEREKPADG